MKQLTLRGFDDELERAIKSEAAAYGISLNQAVLRLLRRGVSMDETGSVSGKIGTALDAHIGTWTDEEAREFEESVRLFEGIDDELWQ